jgi:hypothetical protein
MNVTDGQTRVHYYTFILSARVIKKIKIDKFKITDVIETNIFKEINFNFVK